MSASRGAVGARTLGGMVPLPVYTVQLFTMQGWLSENVAVGVRRGDTALESRPGSGEIGTQAHFTDLIRLACAEGF